MMDVGAVDRKNPQKLFCQLLEILKDPIERGEWKVGMQIPTEEQICGRYGVSKTTVRLPSCGSPGSLRFCESGSSSAAPGTSRWVSP